MFPTEPLYEEAKVFDVRQEYSSSILKFYVKHRLYRTKIGPKNLRSTSEYIAEGPKRNTTIGRRCYDYIAPRLINAMPRLTRKKIYNCGNSDFKDIIDRYIKQTGREAINMN